MIMYWIAYCMVIPICYVFLAKYRRNEHGPWQALMASCIWPFVVLVEFVRFITEIVIQRVLAPPLNKLMVSIWEGLK